MKIVVIIPCRNEARHIKAVVKPIVSKGYKVMVSDDSSTDGTQHYANLAGADVVSNCNGERGYGATLNRGVTVAKKWLNIGLGDIFVFMDGDGQHSPDDISKVLKPLLDNKADVVLGSRLGKHDTRPRYRRLSNAFGTWIANIGTEQKVDDAITGFWAIRSDYLPKTIERGWGISFETLMKCRAKLYMRIASVPIQALWHKNGNDNSTEKAFLLGIIVLWKIVKWRFKCRV